MKNTTSKLVFLLCILLCLIIPTTCKKLEKTMLVSTGEVTNLLTNSADVSGVVVDLGNGATQYGHCYSTTANATTAGSKTQLGVPAPGGFTSQLTNLTAGTKYYIKAYLGNGTEIVYGKEISFTTVAASIPTLITSEITLVTTTTATSGGNVASEGGAPVTARGVCWNSSHNPDITGIKTSDGTGLGTFVSNLTGLTGNTTYYVRAYATNSAGAAYGTEITFTTSALTLVVPTLSTTAISAITQTTASSGGNITSDGGASVTAKGVCWNTSAGATVANSKTSDGTGTGVFTSNLTGLTANTTYYVRAYATNSLGTAYGNEITLTTNSITSTSPSAAAAAVTSLTNTSSTLNGAVNANGNSTSVTFEYGPTILYGSTINATPSPVTGSSPTSVSAALTGLIPGTIYHFRVKAINAGGTTNSDDLSFTTSQVPTATTGAATSIANTTATLNGIVNATNLATTVTFEYGPTVAYGYTATATPNPVTGGNATSVIAGVTGLTLGTTYHYRVKAVSTGGTTYGDDISFTTLQPPTATTTAATSVSNITASLNGSVNANNSSTIVTFEYGLTASYGSTITASQSPVIGNILTNVSADITGLTTGQTYHFKVKAVSAGGTTQGSDLTFTTQQAPTAITTAALLIANTTATLNGTVNANNLPTIVTFEYGLTTSYGSSVTAQQSPVSGNSTTGVNAGITGLAEGKTYHYRISAVSAGGTTLGSDILFTTLQPPTAITTDATSVDTTNATLNGTINANGTSTTVTFEYGTTTVYGNSVTASQSSVTGSSSTSESVVVFGLTPNTVYHFSIKAVSAGGTIYGSDMIFTSLASVRTSAISNITTTTAASGGSIALDGGANITARGVCWSTSANPTIANFNTTDGTGTGIFTSSITGLTISTAYNVRAYATNAGGTSYGDNLPFSTCTPPSATTNAATNLGTSTVTLNGTINANSFSTNVSFDYGTTTSYGSTIIATPSPVTGSSNTPVSGGLSALTSNTLYHYRIKAVNCGGTVYGSDMVFTTIAIPVYVSSAIANATPSILEMTYNLTLANIVPATSAFSVKVNSVARTVNLVAISGTKVLLTLSSQAINGDVITVAYTKPGSNPLQTPSGGQAATISAQNVTNNVN